MTKYKKYIFFIYVIGFITFIGNSLFNINYYLIYTKTLDSLKKTYLQNLLKTKEEIDIVTQNYQTLNEITQLRQENTKLKLTLLSALEYIKEVKKSDKIRIRSQKITKSNIISFVNIANYDKVWIDYNTSEKNKIYGLTYGNIVMGVAIAKENKLLGYLNQDKKCAYSVLIGKHHILAMVDGSNINTRPNIIANYIQSHKTIKINDEVITSGIDNIFFKGIKVGKVVDIVLKNGYKQAIIKPYFSYEDIGYFTYVIDTKLKN